MYITKTTHEEQKIYFRCQIKDRIGTENITFIIFLFTDGLDWNVFTFRYATETGNRTSSSIDLSKAAL